jgi:hypothetical protein
MIAILDPLPDVAMYLMHAPGIYRKTSHGNRLLPILAFRPASVGIVAV